MNFTKEIPDTLVSSEGCAVIIGANNASLQFSVLRKGKQFQPLLWKLDLSKKYLTDTSLYLLKLEGVMYSLKSVSGDQYLTEDHIASVMKYEEHKERNDRGSEAPIFRACVLYCLETLAIHVTDYSYVRFNQDYSKHIISIQTAHLLSDKISGAVTELKYRKMLFDRDFLFPYGKPFMAEATAILMNVASTKELLFHLLSAWIEYIDNRKIELINVTLLNLLFKNLKTLE